MSARVVSQAILGVLALTVLGAAGAGLLWGLPSFLLALAAGALSLVIVLMWASLQQMEESDEMEFEQALSYAAPSAEEEQKRALLRTLKDLEYELSVGKISRDDYDQVYAEVAEKAKRMIALTDEAMKARIAAAEARVSARLESPEPAKEKRKRKQSRPSETKMSEEKASADGDPKERAKGDSPAPDSPGSDLTTGDQKMGDLKNDGEKEDREVHS